jgi:hypothetical protein
MQLLARLPERARSDRSARRARRGVDPHDDHDVRRHDLIHEEQIAAAREALRTKKKAGKLPSSEGEGTQDSAKNGQVDEPEKAARKAQKKTAKKERKREDRASMAEILPG